MALDPFSVSVLLGLGIVLIGVEALMPGFIVIWFGLGFIITSILTLFVPFENGLYQLASVATIGALGVVFLRRFVQESLNKTTPKSMDDFLNVQGVGVITDEGMLKYKGTLWRYRGEGDFAAGEEVNVVSVDGNVALIEKQV
jgi:membrane protein implicated in regulation of membrane protease activity